MTRTVTLLSAIFLLTQLTAQGPEVTSWKLNQGEFGSYYQQGNSIPILTSDSANVLLVQYSSTDVYIHCNGVPDYPNGPFLDGNPSNAGANDYLFRIPRQPQENTGTLTEPGLGHIAILRNGVPIFNAEDAMSYNNQGVWLRNAVYWENDGMDCAKGHPAPNMQGGLQAGFYHHHQAPIPFSSATVLNSAVCNLYPSNGLFSPDPNQHGPLIGYSFDGFPIYGAFGYSDPMDPNSSIARMQSSWQERSISQRTTLPDGTNVPTNQHGPVVSAQYPIGCFIQDFEYVAGSGDLDEHNGRLCVTPEYPNGTYAYFATLDTDWNSDYPYFIGPSYYGVVATDNFNTPGPGGGTTSVVVSGNVTTWNGSTSIAEVEQARIIAYPNPTDGMVRLTLPEGTKSLTITNALGEVIIREELFGTTYDVDLSIYSAGNYLLQVIGEENVSVVRLVRE